VSSDVDSRRRDGHRVDVDLAASTKSFYVFFWGGNFFSNNISVIPHNRGDHNAACAIFL